MSYNQDLEKAVKRLFVEAFPTGIEGEPLGKPEDVDLDNIKGKPLMKVHTPTDTITGEQWKKICKGYLITFTILPNINENIVTTYLGYLWNNWKRGGYKCSEDFINRVDLHLDNLRQVVAKRNKMSFIDEALYDELLIPFENVINQMTWDGSIADKLLKDKAIEHQTDIEMYLKKRVEHNLDLTDEMKKFKGVETLMKEEHLPKSTLEDISKTKEKYSVRHPVSSKSKPQVPTYYQEDYDTNWKCAMEMSSKLNSSAIQSLKQL